MEKSKVYFTDMRAVPGKNLLVKLERLIKSAGISNIDFEGKFTAIKLHFGEPGNLAFLRPNYSKVIADHVKSLGGKPFLTDCNTLYVGRRKDALEHIEAAYENGYSPFSTGCQIIIADGLKGTDDVHVPINGTLVKEAKIGRAIMDADIFISLSHFKGHELTGFGGALKNIGMGCGSRAGKMEQHSDGKPEVSAELCKKCKACTKYCAHNAIEFDASGIASINHDKCVGCGRCIGGCLFDAVHTTDDASEDDLNIKMAEYCYAVLKERPHFHISLVIDVSPFCDCHSENDAAVIPDVGMFASFDPVALDRACADACNKEVSFHNTLLSDNQSLCHEGDCDKNSKKDHFNTMHSNTNWKVCLDHAEKLGIGTQNYELIVLK